MAHRMDPRVGGLGLGHAVAFLLGIAFVLLAPLAPGTSGGSGALAPSAQAGCSPKGLVPMERREQLGEYMEREGFTSGAELGVQSGDFAKITLDGWPSCKKYLLVDVWQQQENYNEAGNADNALQQVLFERAQQSLEPYADKTQFMRMLTRDAAPEVLAASLDYVYVDARHDYCGVMEDLVSWWPKVRPGGILAGHDYVDTAQVKAVHPDEDWGLCEDGSRNDGAVRGAVDEWALSQGLTVSVAFLEDGYTWKSWMVRKPPAGC